MENNNKKKKPVKGLIVWCSINIFALIFLNLLFGGANWAFYIYMFVVAICLVVRLVSNSNLPNQEQLDKMAINNKIAQGEFTASDAVLPSQQLVSKQRDTDQILGDKKQLNEIFEAGETLRNKATAAGARVVTEIKKVSDAIERGVTRATDRVACVLKNLATKDKASLANQSPMLRRILSYTKSEKQYDMYSQSPKLKESFGIDNTSIKHMHVTDFDCAQSNARIIAEKAYVLKPKNYKSFYANLNRNKFSGFADFGVTAQYEDFKQRAGAQAINRQNENMNILGAGGFNMLEDVARFNKGANGSAEQNTIHNTTKTIPSAEQVFGYGDGEKAVNNTTKTIPSAEQVFGITIDSKSAKKKDTLTKGNALNYYLNLVSKGDESANYNVGCCYDFGYGTAVDKKLAVDYYRAGVDAGVAAAENNLALKYDTAEGTYLNKPEAVRLYLSAAQKGDTDAMYNIGNKYILGEGVAVNVTEGIKFLAQSADGGNAKAANSLGSIYYTGAVAQKNITAAFKWFMVAALGGNVMGMYNYALILSDKTNENYNKNEARYWLKKASDKGLEAATKRLDKLNNE